MASLFMCRIVVYARLVALTSIAVCAYIVYCTVYITDGSNPVRNRSLKAVRLSPGQNATEVVVMWSSYGQNGGYVLFGRGVLDRKAIATTARLPDTELVNAPYIQRAVLDRLLPGRKVYYKVCVNDVSSDIYSFVTFNDSRHAPVNLLVASDIGTFSNTAPSLVRDYFEHSRRYNAVFHLGDIAYTLKKNGHKFMESIEKLTTHAQYVTIPGNHESGNNFLHYRYMFSLPGQKWPTFPSQMHFHMKLGSAYFLFYDTNLFDWQPHYVQQQYSWLKRRLAAANKVRNKWPWIIAVGHRPMYCSNYINPRTKCSDLQRSIRHNLEKLFMDHRVDLLLNGHEHSYERTWPVFNFTVSKKSYTNPASPIHIINGSPAVSYYIDKFDPTEKGGPWSAYRIAEPGQESYARLTVHNATHIQWHVVDSVTSRTVDEIYITKTPDV